jgi:hypothetical protein
MVIDSDRTVRYDLYTLPKIDPATVGKSASHQKKAAYLAPYWAAELRKSLDAVLAPAHLLRKTER